MKQLNTIVLITLLLLALTLSAQAVFADQLLQGQGKTELDTQTQAFIGQTGLNSNISFPQFVAQIIKVALSFLGLILVVLIIYAGYLWMIAAGNEEKIKKAKQIMTSAIIGLAIVLSAYAITATVLSQLLNAIHSNGGTLGSTSY